MQKQDIPIKFQNLTTRFYYKQNQLCFQIIINTFDGEQIPYKEFTDYKTYKNTFDQLSKMSGKKRIKPRNIEQPPFKKEVYT